MNGFNLPVVPLTIVVSLALALSFVVFFLRERSRRFADPERESLLPLNAETPRIAGADHDEDDHHHDHDDHDHAHAKGDRCGCRSGLRAPCPGCLKRNLSQTTAR
jgi:hypothetical protein